MHKKILQGLCLLIVLFAVSACEKPDFDETTTHTQPFQPDINALDTGTLLFELSGYDSLTALLDTIYCDQYGPGVNLESYSAVQVKLRFEEANNPHVLPTGAYSLTDFSVKKAEFDPATNTYITVYNKLWTGTQVDATVNITQSTGGIDPLFNIPFNLISGTMEGKLTDAAGEETVLKAGFNQIVRYKL